MRKPPSSQQGRNEKKPSSSNEPNLRKLVTEPYPDANPDELAARETLPEEVGDNAPPFQAVQTPESETATSPASESTAADGSEIVELIEQYQSALSDQDEARASALESRIKSALGLHESVDISGYFSAPASPVQHMDRSGGTVSQWAASLASLRARASTDTQRPNQFAISESPFRLTVDTPVEAQIFEQEEEARLLSGSLTDGLISSSTVFVDYNDNRILDPNEPFTLTDGQGNYSMGYHNGTIVAYGGTDIATGLTNDTIFTAPSGYEYISPLTTVMQSMIDSGSTLEEAENSLKSQYGLDDVNLKTTDPIGHLESGNGAHALRVLNKAIQTADTASMIASMVQGADNTISRSDALSAAYAAIAEELRTGGQLDDQSTLQAVINSCAADCGVDLAAFAVKASTIIAEGNTLLENATGNGQANMDAATAASKIAKLTQDTISTQIKTAIESGDPNNLDAIELAFTGSNLVSAADSIQAGDIDGDGQNDSGGSLNNSPIQSSTDGTAWGTTAIDVENVFSATDPETNEITYFVRDDTAGNGFFTLDSATPIGPANTWHQLTATEFASLEFIGGASGTLDSVSFYTEDSLGWTSTPDSATIHSSTTASADGAADALSAMDANTLFSVDNDAGNPLTYWVRDDAGLGHFRQGGTTYDSGGWQNIGSSLVGLTYVTGNPLDGTDEVQFKAVDASGNESAVETSVITVTNLAPTATSTQATIEANALSKINISSLFGFTDPESDAMDTFLFKTEDAPLVSRHVWNASGQVWQIYDVDCDDWTEISPSFSNLFYTAGNPTGGTETLSFQVRDVYGNVSNTVEVTINVTNLAPTASTNFYTSGLALSDVDISGVFRASDPESDTLNYEIKATDGVSDFKLNGVALTDADADGWYEIGDDLTGLTYSAGNPSDGTEWLKFRAVDSFGNVSNETATRVDVTNQAPVVGAPSATATMDALTTVDISALFTVNDPEGDAITDIWIMTSSDDGYFSRGGTIVDADTWFRINPTFTGLNYTPGNPLDGVETIYAKARDAFGNVSDVQAITVDVTNHAPVVSSSQASFTVNALTGFGLGSILSMVDPEGDAIEKILFKTDDDASVYRRVWNTATSNWTYYDVDCDDWAEISPSFTELYYKAGNPVGGTETLYFAAKDSFGNIANELVIDVNVVNQAPTVSARSSSLSVNALETIDVTSLFSASDPEGGTMQYWIKTEDTPFLTQNGVTLDSDDWTLIDLSAGDLVYSADNPLSGTETLSFKATDDFGNTSAVLDVTMDVKNFAPTADVEMQWSERGGSHLVSDMATFSDRENDALSYYVFDLTTGGGSLSAGGPALSAREWHDVTGSMGTLTYTADTVGGEDSFYMKVVDGHGNYVVQELTTNTYADGVSGIFFNAETAYQYGSAVDFTDLVNVVDPGNTVVSYAVMDRTEGNGSWELGGQTLASGQIHYISPADLGSLTFRRGGLGLSDTIRVWGLDADGEAVMDLKQVVEYWGSASQTQPTMDQYVDEISSGASILITDALTFSDDAPIAEYRLRNLTTDPAYGTISLDGVELGYYEVLDLTTAEFERLELTGGTAGTALSLRMLCTDIYGNACKAKEFSFNNVANMAPQVTIAESDTLTKDGDAYTLMMDGGETLCKLSDFISASDVDGTIDHYVVRAESSSIYLKDADGNDVYVDFLDGAGSPQHRRELPYNFDVSISPEVFDTLHCYTFFGGAGEIQIQAVDDGGRESDPLTFIFQGTDIPTPITRDDGGFEYDGFVWGSDGKAYVDLNDRSDFGLLKFRPTGMWSNEHLYNFVLETERDGIYDISTTEYGVITYDSKEWGDWTYERNSSMSRYPWDFKADLGDVLPGESDTFTITYWSTANDAPQQDTVEVVYYENTTPEITVLDSVYVFSDEAAGLAGITLDQLISVSECSILPAELTVTLNGYTSSTYFITDNRTTPLEWTGFGTGVSLTADQLDQISLSTNSGRYSTDAPITINWSARNPLNGEWDSDTSYMIVDKGLDVSGGIFITTQGYTKLLNSAIWAENSSFNTINGWLAEDNGIDHFVLNMSAGLEGKFIYADTGATVSNGDVIGYDDLAGIGFVTPDDRAILSGESFTITVVDIVGNTDSVTYDRFDATTVKTDQAPTLSANETVLFQGDYITHSQMLTINDYELGNGYVNPIVEVKVYDGSTGADSSYFEVDGVELAAGQWHNLSWEGWKRLRLYGGNDALDSTMQYSVIAQSGLTGSGQVTYSTLDDDALASKRTAALLDLSGQDGDAEVYKINTVGDRDWFKVNLDDSREYIFEAHGVDSFGTGLADPSLNLYWVDYNTGLTTLLVSDDDGGQGQNAYLAYDTTDDNFNFGDYFLEVQSGNGGTGKYMVTGSRTGSANSQTGMQGEDINMWGAGTGVDISLEANLFDFDFSRTFDWGLRSAPLDFNATPYVDFSASLGASLTINSGTMDLTQNVTFDPLMAQDVTAGTALFIDTSSWATLGDLDFSINSPTVEAFIGFETALSAGIKDIWFDVPLFDRQNVGDISLCDFTGQASILDVSPEGIDIPFLGLEFETEIDEEFGALSVEASLPELGDTTLTALGTTGENTLQSATAVGFGDSFLTLGLDLDAIVQAAMGVDDILSGDFTFSFINGEYTALDLVAEFGAKPSQQFDISFDPTDLGVTFTTYASQTDMTAGNVFNTYSGMLGDDFLLDTPDGDGTMYIDVNYSFGGDIRNRTGIQLEGGLSFEMLGLHFEGEVLGASFELDAGPLVDLNPMWDIGDPLYFWDKTTHYDSLMSSTQQFRVDYHDREDIFLAAA